MIPIAASEAARQAPPASRSEGSSSASAGLSRRVLLAAGGTALLAGCAGARVGASSPPAPVDREGLAWVNRIGWGLDSASLDDWARHGRRDYLEAQLHPASGPHLPADVQARVDALPLHRQPMMAWAAEMEQRRRDAQALPDLEVRRAALQAYQQATTALARDASSEFLLRALYSRQPLQEQLTWFWVNHFNVHQSKGNLRALVGDYQQTLRSRALGKFKDLLIASATHAAMIRYLDNEQNAANRINENFAREVMELHTLGVDGGYSQRDVQELARVLTGLGINFGEKTPTIRPALQPLYLRRGATEFNPQRHDMGAKQVLGVDVVGRGWDEIIEQLTLLARQPATARHVCRKLAVYFVADRPDPALVEAMTAAFVGSDGDIAVTLQAMFEAPAFAPSLGHKFKDPVHYVVSAVRLAYDGQPVVNTAPMLGWLNRLGEGLFNHQTPDGYPLDEAAWSSSGQMSARFEVARAIANGRAGLLGSDAAAPVDRPALAAPLRVVFQTGLAPNWSAATRETLAAATGPQEWNVLLLSSPEFMFR